MYARLECKLACSHSSSLVIRSFCRNSNQLCFSFCLGRRADVLIHQFGTLAFKTPHSPPVRWTEENCAEQKRQRVCARAGRVGLFSRDSTPDR